MEVGEEVNHNQKILIFAAMKPWLHILLSCFLLAACAKHEAAPPEEDMLYRMECFYQQKPDSAMQILDTLDVSVLSEKERAHYCILTARTMAMLYMDQAVIDSLIDEAEHYYSGSDEKYYEAMTYWQKGWKTSVSNRMDYRQKALQAIEQCKHVDKRLVRYSVEPTDEQSIIDRLKYAIHQRLGMSYLGSGYYEEALKHLKISEQFYETKQLYHLHLASAYMLSHAYTLVNEHDSSLYYLHKGYESAKAIGNVAECAYYHIGVADHCLYRHDMGQYANEEERLGLLQQSLGECREALRLTDTIGDRMLNHYRIDTYGTMSRAFNLLQQYDSCVYYGEIVLDVLGEGSSKFLLKNLYQSYKALGDEENVARISEMLLNLPDDNGAEQKAIAEVKDDYDHHLELQRLESEQQVRRYRLYLWIGVLLLVLLAVLWLTFRYRKNKELETLRLQEESLRLQSANERMSHEASENLMRRVSYIYRSHEDDAYRHILAEFNAVYPRAISNLKADHPDLSDAEIGVCLLSFLSFRVKEIGIILGFKENTISKYRAYIRSKTGIEEVGDVLLKGYVETMKEGKGVGQEAKK